MKAKVFESTRTPSNPLEPVYRLPSFQPMPPPEPKFIRDSIAVKDIEKAAPKPQIQYKFLRESNYIGDIAGAQPKLPPAISPPNYQYDVRDINYDKDLVFKTSRVSNSLEPRYKYVTEHGQKAEENYGEVIGSTPKRRHPIEVNKHTNFILHCEDIEGAAASTKGNPVIINKSRREFRITNKVDDVEGAFSGSLKKGIVTRRHLNPVDPTYLMPGNKEETTKSQKETGTIQKSPIQKDTKTENSFGNASQLADNSNGVSNQRQSLLGQNTGISPKENEPLNHFLSKEENAQGASLISSSPNLNGGQIQPKETGTPIQRSNLFQLHQTEPNNQGKSQNFGYLPGNYSSRKAEEAPKRNGFEDSRGKFFGVEPENEKSSNIFVPGSMKRDHLATDKIQKSRREAQFKENQSEMLTNIVI